MIYTYAQKNLDKLKMKLKKTSFQKEKHDFENWSCELKNRYVVIGCFGANTF